MKQYLVYTSQMTKIITLTSASLEFNRHQLKRNELPSNLSQSTPKLTDISFLDETWKLSVSHSLSGGHRFFLGGRSEKS